MSSRAAPSGRLPLFDRADAAGTKTALIGPEGSFSFAQLVTAAERGAATLLGEKADLTESRVAMMIPPGFRYTAAQWATWAAGGISVPLPLRSPLPELEYVISDADASVIIT